MKRFILISILLISQYSFAQFPIMVGPTIGLGFSKMKHHDFEQFTESYNQVIQATDTYMEDLKSPRFSSAFSFGIQAVIGPAFLDWGYTKSRASSSVDFKYNQSRSFDFKRREGNYFFGVGWASPEDMYFFSIGGGLNLMLTSIESRYIYSNGVESLGEERVLNGIYSTTALKFSTGARFGAIIEEVLGISLKVDYLFKKGSGADLTYYDFSDGTVFSGGYSWDRIPLSYDPSMLDLPTSEVGLRDFRSDLRLTLALTFFIGSTEI